MSLSKKVANALSFASLAGLSQAKSAKAEEDDKRPDDDDEKKSKAEDENDDASASAEEDDKRPDDDEKKSKAEDENDDASASAEDDTKDDKAKKAARNERSRCKAIVAHGVKVGRVVEACTYAFDTPMSVSAAVSTLDALAHHEVVSGRSAAHTANLAQRMASVKVAPVPPESGRSADASGPSGIAAMVLAAGKKARGEA